MKSSGTFEKLLNENGVLIYKTQGSSMRPLFKQNRDLVIIRPVSGELKKYDVPLYVRECDGRYVLHRIIGFGDGVYIIRGDNTYRKEYIPRQNVIGVLSEFKRKGKNHSVNERGYRLYSRLWNFLYAPRYVLHGVEHVLWKAKKRFFNGGNK